MERLTATDELDIVSMGTVKTALFVIIPDSDTSFNFLVSILYTQLFQTLFYEADHVYKSSLHVHGHFVMDEFANVCLPDDFDKILPVMRSRGVSVSIILQNLAQLKALFEKAWESIIGNCDEFLYLGGNEQSTHKYVSELLGKATIDTNTFGRSTGRSGNYSTNYQNSGRELLTPDEVRMLDNCFALLFIRDERPVQDEKFDILRHPSVSDTTDGKRAPYDHGAESRSNGAMQFVRLSALPEPQTDQPEETNTYTLYSETDLKNLFNEKENASYENPHPFLRICWFFRSITQRLKKMRKFFRTLLQKTLWNSSTTARVSRMCCLLPLGRSSTRRPRTSWSALDTWNEKLAEIWQLITQGPETFKGGTIWNIIVDIHGAVKAIGLGLLVLFFVVGVIKTCGSFAEVKKPEHALKLFIRFALVKAVVTYGLELMMALFKIVQGLTSIIMATSGIGGATQTVLPQSIHTAIDKCGFFESIPLWAVTLIGGLFITVQSFIMIMSVYGRFFKLYLLHG
jgi:hypothetical protein